MTAPGHNRYAMFASTDGSATQVPSAAADPAQNPFLNQVADDSIPWQEVKKRDPSAMQPAPPVRPPRVVKDRTKAILNHPLTHRERDRAISGSTDNDCEKAYDPHENW